MTPIINPWFFYLMSVINGISFAVGSLFIIGIIVLIALGIGYFVVFDSYEANDETIKAIKRWMKNFFILIVTCLAINIFVPTEETITKMIVAQNVTYERVEVVGDAVTNTVETVYNDIMELLDSSSEDSKE